MSVQNEAREAQSAVFERDGAPAELREATLALYSHIDGLTEPQKNLLIGLTLSNVHRMAGQLADTPDNPTVVQGLSVMMGGLIALAGYANETVRDAHGETATGDKAVDEVFEQFSGIVEKSSRARMTAEDVAEAEALAERVRAECAVSGEDHATALGRALAERNASKPQPEKTNDEEGAGYGLYL